MSYVYFARVTDVYDGDSITVDIDLGFGVWLSNQKIRLYGINAPELRDDGGAAARAWLSRRVEGKEVTLETIKDKKGKYGRWLGIILDDDGVVNDDMIEAGQAREYP